MIVVDTNIISYLMIPNDKYNQLADALFQKDGKWSSPALWRHEFLSVLSIYLRQNLIDAAGCKSIFREAVDLVVSKPISDSDRVFDIIEGSSLSAYDCEFVALAIENNLPLITEDKKVIREFPHVAFSMNRYLSV